MSGIAHQCTYLSYCSLGLLAQSVQDNPFVSSTFRDRRGHRAEPRIVLSFLDPQNADSITWTQAVNLIDIYWEVVGVVKTCMAYLISYALDLVQYCEDFCPDSLYLHILSAHTASILPLSRTPQTPQGAS